MPILLLAGMNHHLRRPLFLRHCLVFSEACVTLSGRHTNLSKLNPQERATHLARQVLLRVHRVRRLLVQIAYILATSAYWVPLSKLVKNVTRAKAVQQDPQQPSAEPAGRVAAQDPEEADEEDEGDEEDEEDEEDEDT